MKAVLLLAIFSFTAIDALTQKFDSATLSTLAPPVRLEVEAHVASAKKATHIGHWFLIGGASIQVGSIIFAALPKYSDNQDALIMAAIAFLTGTSMAFASIPFYDYGNKERAKARLLIYNNQQVFIAPGVSLPNTGSQGIGIVIPLGK